MSDPELPPDAASGPLLMAPQRQRARSVVLMGVAGCGKSSVGAALADRLGWHWLEGDDFHGMANRDKMSRGIALDDQDRAAWLDALGLELTRHREWGDSGLVLSCSALKRTYRDRLRAAAPGLHFIFLEIDRPEASRRLAQRSHHFFPESLVASQFETLEPPAGESDVLTLAASDVDVTSLVKQAVDWIRRHPHTVA